MKFIVNIRILVKSELLVSVNYFHNREKKSKTSNIMTLSKKGVDGFVQWPRFVNTAVVVVRIIPASRVYSEIYHQHQLGFFIIPFYVKCFALSPTRKYFLTLSEFRARYVLQKASTFISFTFFFLLLLL